MYRWNDGDTVELDVGDGSYNARLISSPFRTKEEKEKEDGKAGFDRIARNANQGVHRQFARFHHDRLSTEDTAAIDYISFRG